MPVTEPPAPDILIPTRNNHLTSWTDERTKRAIEMFKDGQSASEIARELGHVSRNAVIGKLARNGVRRHEKTRALGVRTYSKRPGGYAMRMRSALRRELWRGAELTELPADTADNPIMLMDLENHHCRWPCSGTGATTLYCGGEAIEHLSYCARHCRIAYTLPKERMTRAQYEERAKKLAADYKAGKAT